MFYFKSSSPVADTKINLKPFCALQFHNYMHLLSSFEKQTEKDKAAFNTGALSSRW